MFDGTEVRARLPLPPQAEMRLRRFVDKRDVARVGRVEVRFVLPLQGNACAVDLDARRQLLRGAIAQGKARWSADPHQVRLGT